MITHQAAVATPHATKGEAAYLYLREAILDGRLRPGQRVTLATLAQDMGMSQMPVREALKQLAREGLVVVTPHTETLIAPFELGDVQNIFAVKANLESLAARLAAGRVTPTLLAALGDLHAEMGGAMAVEDYETFARCNRRFHEEIFEAAGNPHLHRLLEEVWAQSFRFRAGYRIIPGRAAKAYDEHEVLILALRAGNADLAEVAMKSHISRAGSDLVELIADGKLDWPDLAAGR
ncbi:GntR family transcriptional regulator [Dactylosporangium sp. CA-092794]|uniref:GntR family transcriptional regulator n=1 Tax=Dactylosporangium sp. CA-092794 TaxID=3239929 RepID=UPI003D9196D0